MRGWPLVFDPPYINLPEWIEDDGLSTLLSIVHNNVSWGKDELAQRQKRISDLLPFIHVVKTRDNTHASGELIVSVGSEQFTVPVINNSMALMEPVNCFAVPSRLGSNIYLVNAVFAEDYIEGTLTSSGYLYVLPANKEGIFVSDGFSPFFRNYQTTFTTSSSGLYIRYLPDNFIALSKDVSVYIDEWIEAEPAFRYIHEYEDMVICNIKTRAVVVSEREIRASLELKKHGRVTTAEPEWGIAAELYLGDTFPSNRIPSGIINTSFEAQLNEYMLDDTAVTALLWEPHYTAGYLSSVDVLLPDTYPLQMVGYRDILIEKPLVPVTSPSIWGDSFYYESSMDVLDV